MLLVDEPTGSLDETSSKDVGEILKRYASEKKKTVILATHDPELARAADRIVELSYGRLGSRAD